MTDTNYVGGIVQILETPKQKNIKSNTINIQFRAKFSNAQIVYVNAWDDLANEVISSYKMNDYIIIEGYISFRNKQISELMIFKVKKVEITIFRVDPYLLKYDRLFIHGLDNET